ncbi:hypothetical protein REPUB_Repub04eG0186400 [Reevesia pubescens]
MWWLRDELEECFSFAQSGAYGRRGTENSLINRLPKWIKWKPPQQDHNSLNTDSAFKQSTSIASAGGLIRNYRGLGVIEVDATFVVSQLTENDYLPDHPPAILLKDCQALMSFFRSVDVKHFYREGNHCADCLATMANIDTMLHGTFILESPSPQLLELIKDDVEGLAFLKL